MKNHFDVTAAAGAAPRSANGPGDCANRGTCTARDGLRGGVFAAAGVGATATSAGFFAFLFVGVFGDLAAAGLLNCSPPIHSPPELETPEDVAGRASRCGCAHATCFAIHLRCGTASAVAPVGRICLPLRSSAHVELCRSYRIRRYGSASGRCRAAPELPSAPAERT